MHPTQPPGHQPVKTDSGESLDAVCRQILQLPPDAKRDPGELFVSAIRHLVRPKPTLNEVLRQLRRQLEAAPGRWLRCSLRQCRRRRRCSSPELYCSLVVLSPEQRAQTLAQLNRALAER